MAAKTYLGWKWMSAMTGIWLFRAISGSASASSWLGHATRTMSQPAAVSSAICWRVALMSVVGVVHIDWTEIGASPPTSTLPTRILRVRTARGQHGGGADGIPRETLMRASIAPDRRPWRRPACRSAAELDRVDDVGVPRRRP